MSTSEAPAFALGCTLCQVDVAKLPIVFGCSECKTVLCPTCHQTAATAKQVDSKDSFCCCGQKQSEHPIYPCGLQELYIAGCGSIECTPEVAELLGQAAVCSPLRMFGTIDIAKLRAQDSSLLCIDLQDRATVQMMLAVLSPFLAMPGCKVAELKVNHTFFYCVILQIS